jgi:hypothetical protein
MTAAQNPKAASGPGSYVARIRRGRMAADQFTQIRNDLFRDPRLSFKAKGVFGLISTHREGYGISIPQIAKAGKDGEAAVRTALRELEAFGYLHREQTREEDGRMGPAEYYITDDPASVVPNQD